MEGGKGPRVRHRQRQAAFIGPNRLVLGPVVLEQAHRLASPGNQQDVSKQQRRAGSFSAGTTACSAETFSPENPLSRDSRSTNAPRKSGHRKNDRKGSNAVHCCSRTAID